MKITRQIHEVQCDRCGAKVTAKGGRIAFDHGTGPVAVPDDVSDEEFTSDLCRVCLKSLRLWWMRAKDEPDDEDDETCGVRDADHTCQLAPGHEGPHAEPSETLDTVHTWSTPPDPDPNTKPAKGKAAKS